MGERRNRRRERRRGENMKLYPSTFCMSCSYGGRKKIGENKIRRRGGGRFEEGFKLKISSDQNL
ncbi:unnamed protein product [Musa textilis]